MLYSSFLAKLFEITSESLTEVIVQARKVMEKELKSSDSQEKFLQFSGYLMRLLEQDVAFKSIFSLYTASLSLIDVKTKHLNIIIRSAERVA